MTKKSAQLDPVQGEELKDVSSTHGFCSVDDSASDSASALASASTSLVTDDSIPSLRPVDINASKKRSGNVCHHEFYPVGTLAPASTLALMAEDDSFSSSPMPIDISVRQKRLVIPRYGFDPMGASTLASTSTSMVEDDSFSPLPIDLNVGLKRSTVPRYGFYPMGASASTSTSMVKDDSISSLPTHINAGQKGSDAVCRHEFCSMGALASASTQTTTSTGEDDSFPSLPIDISVDQKRPNLVRRHPRQLARPSHLQRSLSGDPELDSSRRRFNGTLGRPERTRSLTDGDLEELQGCVDLGFGFGGDESSELKNTLPALEFYYAINKQFKEMETRSSPSSPLDAATTAVNRSSCSSPRSDSWRISSPGDDPDEVKMRLRHWAQAVACSVKQSL